MTHICDNYYFDSDGREYTLYLCERREILSLGKKEPTGKVKDHQETLGHYASLAGLIKGCVRHATKCRVKNGSVETLHECLEYVNTFEEKILDATKGY